MSDQLRAFIDRKLAGESAPIEDLPFDDGTAAYRAALLAEQRADVDDGGTEEPEAPEFDPGELSRFTDAASAAMGFGAQAQEPATTQELAFEAADEAGQDGRWARWFEGLAPEDQAAALAGDPAAVDSFARWIEESSDARLGAVADQIEGARLVEDPLHRPLRRFSR